MGIHDRDYIRQPQRRGAGGGFRLPSIAMTATMWLIIINVGVHVVDFAVQRAGFGSTAVLGAYPTSQNAPSDRSDMEVVPGAQERWSREYPGLIERPLRDKQTSEQVAMEILKPMGPLKALGFFSTGKVVELQVWRFVTFQFLHADRMHLIFNMIGLFFFAPIAERYLGSRRLFVSFYLVCGMAGAALYLLLNLAGILLPFRVPGVLVNEVWVPLVGASAGVFGVLWAAAYIAGDARMYVMGVIPMKIRTGVILFTVIAFWNLVTDGNNAGGDAAHIGGAIAGFFFIRNPHILLNFFDEFFRTSKRHPKFARGTKRVKGGPKLRLAGQEPPTTAARQQRLNGILDKIRTQGEGALTPDERTFLERETDRRQR